MKLSIAIAGAFVAGVAANAVSEPEADLGVDPSDFHYAGRHREGHGFVPREAEAAGAIEIQPVGKRDMMGGRMPGRGMPCPKAQAAGMGMRRVEYERTSDSWVPGPLNALLWRLGLGIEAPPPPPRPASHHYKVVTSALDHEHSPDHGDGHHKVHHAGHAGHHSEGDNVDFSIFVPVGHPIVKEEDMIRIMPIFGDHVNAEQEAHRQKLKQLKAEAEEDDDDDDDDEEEHHHKHKHHKYKSHKHKHHKGGKKYKHKHHKGGKHMLKGMGHKACNMFGSLPGHVRAGLSALMAGTLFLALCALVFHIGRRGRISREERKARRQQRKDARRAAKAAYKATKAARSSKEAEAGFALAQDASEAEREALPSYKDNETDALIERQ